MDGHTSVSGPDPARVASLEDLARELGLLRARAARGSRSARVSLDELSSRVGEPKSTIHSYLVGRRLPPAQLLDRMVIALGSTPAELHEWAEAWYRVGAVRDAARRGGSDNQFGGSVPHQLPLPVDRFVGRIAQLAELDEVLAGGASTRLALISGTAGVGKTALAMRWAHDNTDRFPDGQLYLDLRGFDLAEPLGPVDALIRLLRALGVPWADSSIEVDELAARYRSELSGRRMLIILDNAVDSEHVRPLLPGSSTCATVLTSRDSMPGLIARQGGHRIDLPLLSMDSATELLRTLIGQQPAPASPGRATGAESTAVELAALADTCARLPLALRIAAEVATSRRGMPLTDLIRELSAGHHELDLLEAGDDARSALRSVFSWSYRRLPARIAAAFRLLSVHPGVDLTAAAMGVLIDTSAAEAQRAIDVLARAHLIEEHTPGRYTVHSLLRAYAGELATATDADQDRRDALIRLVEHYLQTAAVALGLPAGTGAAVPADPVRGDTWAAGFADDTAGGCWLDAEYANAVAAVELAGHGELGERSTELARTVGPALVGSGSVLAEPVAPGLSSIVS